MSEPVLTKLPERTPRFTKLRNRHGWLAAIAVLLIIMVAWRASQVPVFGGFQVRTITAGTLAIALLAMGQAVVVISGGFNMAIGAMLVFTNCFSAWLMQGRSFLACIIIALGTIALSAAISAAMGAFSVYSGVPDMIVTLAMSFVLPGAALLILGGPGGGTHQSFVNLVVGGFSDPLPSIGWMLFALVVLWLPLSRSRLGKSIYAVGSNRQAAFLAGVNVGRTRVMAYVYSGIFAGMAGVATTAYTASGEPRAAIGMGMLMNAVAAVVLGGVALSGGVGGMTGPVLAACVLSLIPAIMLGLGMDPNTAETVRGMILIGVVLMGGWLQIRRSKP